MDSSTDFTAGYKNFFIEREMGYMDARGIRVIYNRNRNDKDNDKFFFYPRRQINFSDYIIMKLSVDKTKLIFGADDRNNYGCKIVLSGNDLYKYYNDKILLINNQKIFDSCENKVFFYKDNVLKIIKTINKRDYSENKWTFFEKGKKILDIMFYEKGRNLNKVFIYDLDVTEVSKDYYIYKNKKYTIRLLYKKFDYNEKTRTYILPLYGKYAYL